jgi:hypothetical protein
MASEIKANKISPATGTAFTFGDSGDTFTVPSGTTLDIASGATLDATGATVSGLTTGKVLQLQSVELAGSTAATTSTSYIDTGLNISITPTASTSKIIVIANTIAYVVASSKGQFSARLIDNGSSTVLCEWVNIGIPISGTTNIQQVSLAGVFSCSDTSALTFKTQMHMRSGSSNLYYLGQQAGAKHTIIAMEIAA